VLIIYPHLVHLLDSQLSTSLPILRIALSVKADKRERFFLVITHAFLNDQTLDVTVLAENLAELSLIPREREVLHVEIVVRLQ
jgi:hypothetical protein